MGRTPQNFSGQKNARKNLATASPRKTPKAIKNLTGTKILTGALITTTINAALLMGVSTPALATCTALGHPPAVTHSCTGTLTNSQDLSSSVGLNVETDASFSIDTSLSTLDAFRLITDVGNGGLIFKQLGSGEIKGDKAGIHAENYGSQATNITTLGKITGVSEAIYVKNHANSTDLIISAEGDIVSEKHGLEVENEGTGDTTINVKGNITTINRDAINVDNASTTGNITITTEGLITSGSDGLDVTNEGSGDTNITTKGQLIVDSEGIQVENENDSGNLNILAEKDISSGSNAITVNNKGNGDTNIIAKGNLTARDENETIRVNAEDTTKNITILSEGDVTGESALYVNTYGSGETKITAKGKLTGLEYEAIDIDISGENSGSVTLIAEDEVSAKYAILELYNNGIGDSNVTFKKRSTGRQGLQIRHRLTAGKISVTADGELINEDYSVYLNSESGKDIDLNVSNKLEAKNTIIVVRKKDVITGKDSITLKSGADVISTDTDGKNLAIAAGSGDTTLILQEGSKVTGKIALDKEVELFSSSDPVETISKDTLVLQGGDISGLVEADAGADIDTLSFKSEYNIANGFFDKFLNFEETTIDAGGKVFFTDGVLTTNKLSLINGGILNLENGATKDRFTLNGELSGDGNGIIAIDTELAGDDSNTDKLLINGNVTGTTKVKINKIGNAGEKTVNGISIIEVSGAASSDAFSLIGDYKTKSGEQALLSGAYLYTLAQDGNDWKLSSKDKSGAQRYQPTTPLYDGYNTALLANSASNIQTFSQRFHNTGAGYIPLSGSGDDSNDDLNNAQIPLRSSGLWTRIEGSSENYRPKNSATNLDADTKKWAVNVGTDFKVYENENGSIFIGGNLFHGQQNTNITALSGNGDIDTTAFGIGASIAYVSNDNFYVDGQFSYAWLENNITSNAFGAIVNDNRGNSFNASLELGKRFDLGDNYGLTPQAQVSWSQVNFDDFTAPNGETVRTLDGTRLETRIGLGIDKNFSWQAQDGTTRKLKLEGIANLYYSDVDSAIAINNATFDQSSSLWSGELGVAASYSWQDSKDNKWTLFGEAKYRAAFDDISGNNSLSGNMGIKLAF